MEKGNFKRKLISFHDKNYKLLLLIPLALLIFCFVYMGIFYSNNHNLFYKDISLTGGTSVTIDIINEPIDINSLKDTVSEKLGDVNVREISDLITRQQKAVIVETKSDEKIIRQVLEEYLGYELNGENSSFEFTGATLSENFYKQLLIALLIAFVLMSIVVFIQFKSFIPSMAVILSAFADILMPLVLINILGIQISTAGIVAFLMLIGYSVDTDILLINKVLRREGESVNRKIFDSFKTGMTMTLTSLFAVLAALFIVGPFSSILYQIFLIMGIGLGFDILNTWLTNTSIIKWYVSRKGKNKSFSDSSNTGEKKNEN
ncbi:MAG TPA: protein translocase subunit SecF [Candidatus Nanoarchaeia archaeon]|nr:protein translocase subunit SecF [Candidatus Nanoarchaeia archaeon]